MCVCFTSAFANFRKRPKQIHPRAAQNAQSIGGEGCELRAVLYLYLFIYAIYAIYALYAMYAMYAMYAIYPSMLSIHLSIYAIYLSHLFVRVINNII